MKSRPGRACKDSPHQLIANCVVQFNYSLYRTTCQVAFQFYLRRPDLALRLADAPDAEPPRENELGLDAIPAPGA